LAVKHTSTVLLLQDAHDKAAADAADDDSESDTNNTRFMELYEMRLQETFGDRVPPP
jgi:hypothetical protein